MEKLEKLELSLLGFPTESSDGSPSTAISTLPHLPTPLPPAQPGSWIQVGYGAPPNWSVADVSPPSSGDSWETHHVQEAAPKAPLLKDLDSFTEGTGKGSFDSILDDSPVDQGDLFCHPNSLELLSAHEPTTPLSIETWREQVSGHFYDLGTDMIQDMIQDTQLTISMSVLNGDDAATLELNLGSDDLPQSGDLEPRHSVPSSLSPRPMKRSRSRSPEPSRRTRSRPRSKSMSSIKSLTLHILDGLSGPRVKGFLQRFPPFD